MAVNVSPRSLHHAAFPGRIRDMLDAHGVAPSSLTLEITENLVMSDPDGSLRCLDELHEMGVRLVIDDFGKGYSSLSYLRRLPVDEIKIDRSFIIGLADGEDDTLVRCMIELAHNLGMTVVAEGVETEAVLQQLAELNCDAAQGYFIARPAPADDIADWISSRAVRPCAEEVCSRLPSRSSGDQLRFSSHVVRPPRASLPPSPFLERPGRSLRVNESTHKIVVHAKARWETSGLFVFRRRQDAERLKSLWILRNSTV